jgi:O-antigen/teichoic acid export membrane protein
MLKNKTILGVFWTFFEQLLRRGTSVLVTLLLAYFLTPKDYGLIAMISLFLALGSALVDSGFKQAIIRKAKVTNTDLNTAFYANLFLAFVAYFILYLIAPLVSVFYDEPQLVLFIRVSAILIIFNSFQIVQSALLSKNMQFKVLLKANVPAAFLSGGCAVLLAYFQYGVWALIAQMIISSLLVGLFLWVQNSWRPSCVFSLNSLKEMYSYGYKLFLSNLLNILYKNLFVIIIAKTFSVILAGFYFFADRIKELLIGQLIASIQIVTFPALSAIQDDSVRLKAAYMDIMQLMTFLVFPVLLVFVSMSELIFEIILPVKWLPVVPYLQIMCITSLVIPIVSVNLNIIKIKGRSDWYLILEFIKKTTGLFVLIITMKHGVIAILFGQLFSQLLNYFPSVYLSSRLVAYNLTEQLKDFIPNLLLSIFVAALIWFVQPLIPISGFIKLLMLLFFSILIFLLTAYVFKMRALSLFISTAKGFLKVKP